MGIQLGSQFTMNAALPLDDRATVANNTARDAIVSGRRYEGMIVYVEAEETNYQLIGGITNTDWQELSGAGGGSSSTTGNLALTNNALTSITAIGEYLTSYAAIIVNYYLYRRVVGTNKRMSGSIALEAVFDAVLNADKWQMTELIRSEYGGDSGVTFSLNDIDTDKSVLEATLDDFSGASHDCVFYYTLTKLSISSDYQALVNNTLTAIADITGDIVSERAVLVDYYIYRRNDSGYKTVSGKLFIESVNDGATDADKWKIFEAERSESFADSGITFSLTNPATGTFLLNATLDDMGGTGHDCKIYFKINRLTV